MGCHALGIGVLAGDARADGVSSYLDRHSTNGQSCAGLK